MISILFWNIARTTLKNRVARLAKHCNADFIILAESADAPSAIVGELNAIQNGQFSIPQSENGKIQLYTRLPIGNVTELFSSSRMSVRSIKLASSTELLLAIAHFPSKVNWSDDDLAMWSTTISEDIRIIEAQVGHNRTVLVGDLNMNPFESGMIGAQGLHAMMSSDVAERNQREVSGRSYPMFYNPMWGLFGDRTPGPSGTFFHRAAKPINYFWNMFDQVLLRPSIMRQLVELKIVDHDGSDSLLTDSGHPDPDISDHLPLFLKLDV